MFESVLALKSDHYELDEEVEDFACIEKFRQHSIPLLLRNLRQLHHQHPTPLRFLLLTQTIQTPHHNIFLLSKQFLHFLIHLESPFLEIAVGFLLFYG